MILVIGHSSDPCVAGVAERLADQKAEYAVLGGADDRYSIRRSPEGSWRVLGGDCLGLRPVNAIFFRHGATPSARNAGLRARVDRMLLAADCRVINRPSNGFGNFSKPFQLLRLAAAGFNVPATLVTNMPDEARVFIASTDPATVLKGVSSAKTIPVVVEGSHLDNLHKLRACPAQFQELIGGIDYRVTVVGNHAVATLSNEGVPRDSRLAHNVLPTSLVRRCVKLVRDEGLEVGGFDMRLTDDGSVHVFEMNPYPLFTYYDVGQPNITDLVVHHLQSAPRSRGNVLS